MKNLHLMISLGLTLGCFNLVLAQAPKTYQDMCVQNQVKLHEKLKGISPNDFRSFCDCTHRQLLSTLSQAQLEELQTSNKKPSWLRPTEEAASKACLKPNANLQV